ncbi:MAG TPA: preprotein translocase subunit YajC [Chitinophagales bacterium]|nr:preprotein translocase subunit YajC [Chitinophagales bacterium]
MNLITIFLMTTPSGSSSGAGYMNLVLLVAVFGVMYFFMIRPQSKKAKDQRTFLENLQKGDKVITVAGIHGRISKVNENGTLEVEIDTNTKVVMERSGISMEYTRTLQGVTPAQK